MEKQWPFEFGRVYFFHNNQAGKGKLQIYIKTLDMMSAEGLPLHYFFFINSKRRAIYEPHYEFFINDSTGKKYSFLRKDRETSSFVSCKSLTNPVSPPDNCEERERMSYQDMKGIARSYESSPVAYPKLIEYMNHYLLQNKW